MILSVINSSGSNDWIGILKRLFVYQYNIKTNLEFNNSPVYEFIGYNGFNTEHNVLSKNNQDKIQPKETEMDGLNEFRKISTCEISSVSRRIIRRAGLGFF